MEHYQRKARLEMEDNPPTEEFLSQKIAANNKEVEEALDAQANERDRKIFEGALKEVQKNTAKEGRDYEVLKYTPEASFKFVLPVQDFKVRDLARALLLMMSAVDLRFHVAEDRQEIDALKRSPFWEEVE